MFRRLILVGALASATAGSAVAVEAASASADTPPLTAAQQLCQNDYRATFFPGVGFTGYTCVGNPSSRFDHSLKPAQQQCENAYKGTFSTFALGYICATG